MYINAVIEACDRLYPNEYTLQEKYTWCDELSAMLMQEYKKEYVRVRLKPDSDGTYLLPEGVEYEAVDRIFDGRKELTKQDFRSFGVRYFCGVRGRLALPQRHRVRGDIEVVYLKAHTPIRNIVITDASVFVSRLNYFEMKEHPFIVGDVLKFTVNGHSADNVTVLEIEEQDTETDRLYVNEGAFDDILDSFSYTNEFGEDMGIIEGSVQADITRYVTEKTVCPAPYDSMYIDYINAKISYYQGSFGNYNQHMMSFNNKLSAYQLWLKERCPLDCSSKITNWW